MNSFFFLISTITTTSTTTKKQKKKSWRHSSFSIWWPSRNKRFPWLEKSKNEMGKKKRMKTLVETPQKNENFRSVAHPKKILHESIIKVISISAVDMRINEIKKKEKKQQNSLRHAKLHILWQYYEDKKAMGFLFLIFFFILSFPSLIHSFIHLRRRPLWWGVNESARWNINSLSYLNLVNGNEKRKKKNTQRIINSGWVFLFFSNKYQNINIKSRWLMAISSR